jgi:hypothetical protein
MKVPPCTTRKGKIRAAWVVAAVLAAAAAWIAFSVL